MLGFTLKYVGSHEIDDGMLIFVEEYPAQSHNVTAAPIGAPIRRVEVGAYDTLTAQAIQDFLGHRFPSGVATPQITDMDIQQARLAKPMAVKG